ncbi:hypothetical protein V8G54_010762 [Vigna mungo]|uniref:Uncharacterized protein n=1 Tax=Vigna mungo TaxID=3915 RepID=A0AAQ3NXP7_VIGMU
MAASTLCFALLIPLIFFHTFHASSSFSLSVENFKEEVILSSPKPTFTAGFYAVGQNAFCFAVWYTHLPDTLVWIANRDQPVNGKRSTLSLLKTGNLVLTDAGQLQVWSTGTATSSRQVRLHLYDTGNLVLLEDSSDSAVLWQSFDFPTDTLLPNQPLRGSTNLVSSRSGSNHSSGFYRLFFDFENVLRLMYQGPRVSSVFWPYAWLQSNNFGNGNGRSTFNDSRVAVLDELGGVLSSDNYTFRTIDYGTVLQRRLTLDHDGNVRVYSMVDGQEKWMVSGLFRQQPCFIHGICGPNSYCTNDPTIGRKCSCLPGHRWIDSQDWTLGCRLNFDPWCNTTKQESRFVGLAQFDFYGYDYGFYQNHTYEQCVNQCLQLCECKGFQFSFSDQGGFGSQCYLKTQLLNGHYSVSFSGSFFLRLPLSHDYENPISNVLVCGGNNGGLKELERPYVEEKENGSVRFMLWFACALGGLEVLCFFLVWCFLFRNNADKQAYVLAAETGLVTWVREKRKKGSEVGSSWVDQIVDPALESKYDRNEMEMLATVALECVEEEKDVRPSMSHVVERLQSYEHNS